MSGPIRRWIDLGLTVCPKTRQTLAHTNLIPNYTVKALIANWCESNDVKLPDPTKSITLKRHSSLLANAELGELRRVNNSGTPNRSISSPIVGAVLSTATRRDGTSPSHPRSPSVDSFTEAAVNGNGLDLERVSPRSSGDRSDHSGERNLNSGGSLLMYPSINDVGPDIKLPQGHNRTISQSSIHSNSNLSQGTAADANEVASHDSAHVSDASGELNSEPRPASNLSAPQRDNNSPSRLEPRPRGQSIWRRPSERFGLRLVSSPTVETRPDLLEVDTQVKKLVEDLKSSSIDVQRTATHGIRVLAKHNMDNRIIIANCGAIILLVNLLRSSDLAHCKWS